MTHMPKRKGECDAHYVDRLRDRAKELGYTIEVGPLASDGWRAIRRVRPNGTSVNIGAVRTLALFDGGCMCSR